MSPGMRWARREPVSLEVKLCRPGDAPLSCKARNLSVEGMLLEMEGGSVLGIGDGVTLSVQADMGLFEVPSVVLHSNANCVGLMFQEPQPQLYRLMVHAVRNAHGPIDRHMLFS